MTVGTIVLWLISFYEAVPNHVLYLVSSHIMPLQKKEKKMRLIFCLKQEVNPSPKYLNSKFQA